MGAVNQPINTGGSTMRCTIIPAVKSSLANPESKPKITVHSLLRSIEGVYEHEVVYNMDAFRLSRYLHVSYPYNPITHKYEGNFNGDQITCFICFGDEQEIIFAVYGTCDDAVCVNDCVPSFESWDRVEQVF